VKRTEYLISPSNRKLSRSTTHNGQVLPMVGDFIFVRPEQLLI